MWLFNVRNNNQGFTLIETLIIIIIVGVLSAMTFPSFLAMLNKSKVNDALVQLQGALQEAQREAIRRSQSCTVTINTTNSRISSPCLITGERELCYNRNPLNGNCNQTVSITTNISPSTITFSFRGNTTVTLPAGADHPKIVLHMPNGSTQEKKCLAISNGIGIMRTGIYTDSTASASDITNGTCTTS